MSLGVTSNLYLSVLAAIQEITSVAQLVEQRTVNPCVVGSSPTWGAKILCGMTGTVPSI